MLLPTTCPVCRRPGPAPCAACRAELWWAPTGPTPPGLSACHALLAYDGAGRELVARLKYGNARASLGWLADGLAGLVAPGWADVVTWAPTTADRARTRGFDQAELLARRVARRLRVPARSLLRRQPGPAQTGRRRAERIRGPTFSPGPAARGRRSPPARVVLVDDVVTTGASLAAAARVLRRAGVGEVIGLVAARTPEPGWAPESSSNLASWMSP